MKKLIAVMAAMLMTMMVFTGCSGGNTVLTIDGDEIPMGEAVFILREMETMYENQYGPTIWTTGFEGQTFNDIAKAGAIDSLTRLYITKLYADEKGISLTDEELAEIDVQIEEYSAVFSEEALKEDNISMDDVKNIFIYNALGQKLMDVELADFVVDQEVLDAALAADGNYQQIQTYGYEGVLEEVTAQHILISTVNEDQSEKTDEEKAQALETAEMVLELVKAGDMTFEELVTEYSEDPGSVNNGGTYTFYKGMMAKEFEDAAFNMEIDEVSELVQTQFGYHIIKKLDHIKASEEDIQNVMEFEGMLVEQYEMVQKQEAYNALYEEWQKDYEVVLNEKVWEKAQTTYEKLVESGEIEAPASPE